MATARQRFADTVRPGDLVLYHYPGFQFLADTIEWFEGDGHVSHCSMVFGPLSIVDVKMSGVVLTTISEYMDGKTKIIVRRIRGLKEDAGVSMSNVALCEVGRGYGFRKVVWTAVVAVAQRVGAGRLLAKCNPFRKERDKTCSGSYARIAMYHGHDLVPGTLPENATPEDLLKSGAMETILEI